MHVIGTFHSLIPFSVKGVRKIFENVTVWRDKNTIGKFVVTSQIRHKIWVSVTRNVTVFRRVVTHVIGNFHSLIPFSVRGVRKNWKRNSETQRENIGKNQFRFVFTHKNLETQQKTKQISCLWLRLCFGIRQASISTD